MKVLWPFGVAHAGEASSRLMLRWLETVVVSDEEKAQVYASGGDQEDDCCLKRRKALGDIETGALRRVPGWVWRLRRLLARWCPA